MLSSVFVNFFCNCIFCLVNKYHCHHRHIRTSTTGHRRTSQTSSCSIVSCLHLREAAVLSRSSIHLVCGRSTLRLPILGLHPKTFCSQRPYPLSYLFHIVILDPGQDSTSYSQFVKAFDFKYLLLKIRLEYALRTRIL